MTSDEALMLEFQRGSRPALDELFARYRQPLYGFFRRRLDDKERAEDLTQETFLVVMRVSSRYEPLSLVRTYLYGIAIKLLASERRTQFRSSSTVSFSVDSLAEPSVQRNSDAVLWVKQALERLDDSEREILMLREYEQLSYAEIAQLLQLPINTVRSKLFRSRLTLRERLEPQLKATPEIADRIESNCGTSSSERGTK